MKFSAQKFLQGKNKDRTVAGHIRFCNYLLITLNYHPRYPQVDTLSAARINCSANLMMSEFTPARTDCVNPLRNQLIFDCCKIITCNLTPTKKETIWLGAMDLTSSCEYINAPYDGMKADFNRP